MIRCLHAIIASGLLLGAFVSARAAEPEDSRKKLESVKKELAETRRKLEDLQQQAEVLKKKLEGTEGYVKLEIKGRLVKMSIPAPSPPAFPMPGYPSPGYPIPGYPGIPSLGIALPGSPREIWAVKVQGIAVELDLAGRKELLKAAKINEDEFVIVTGTSFKGAPVATKIVVESIKAAE